MGYFRRFSTTKKGLALIARVLNGETNILFTKVCSGDGEYQESENLESVVSLKGKKQEFPISAKEIVNENTIKLKTALANDSPSPLSSGYHVRELGVYAKSTEDSAQEFLYAIFVADSDQSDYMPPYQSGQPVTKAIDIFVKVANTGSVTIQRSNASYALASELEAETKRAKEEEEKKVASSGGDAGNTIVSSIQANSTDFPVPKNGETLRSIIGKIVKWMSDMLSAHETEKSRASDAERSLADGLMAETKRAHEAEKKEFNRAKGIEDSISLRLDDEVKRAKAEEEKKIDASKIVNNTLTDNASMVASSHVTYELQLQINSLSGASIKTEGGGRAKVVKMTLEHSASFPNRLHIFSEGQYEGFVDLSKN